MRPRSLLIPVCLLTLLAVSGCGRHDGGRRGASGGLATARVNAAGESPNWSAVVRPGSLAVSVGDAAPLQVKPSVTDQGVGGASWSGALPANGGTVGLTVTPKACKDGETGLAYPMTAVASVQGRRYAGCAAHPGQGLGPRT